MTDMEIEERNSRIKKHNKFCFMKKSIPLYKEPVPMSQIIVYLLISAILFTLPSIFSLTQI